MSLDWSVEKCADSDALINEDNWFFTEGIIWATMAVGIGRLTATNMPEFYARIKVLERLRGPFFWDVSEPILITPDMLHPLIGLSTNVSTEGRVAWLKRVTEPKMLAAEKEAQSYVSSR